MTAIAPHIAAFLRDHLASQRGASPHTCETYAYSFCLLFEFASQRFKVSPSALGLREVFFAAVRTVRPVSGQDLKLSPEFAAAAKTYLDLVAAPGGAADH